MKLTKKFRENALLVVLGVVLFWALSNYKLALNILDWGLDILKPFIIGAVIAFILNVPMSGIEKRLFKKTKTEKGKKFSASFKRPLSIVLTFLIAFGVLALVCWLVIPALIKTFAQLTADLPTVAENLANKIKNNAQISSWLKKLGLNPSDLTKTVTYSLNGFSVLGTLNSTVGVLAGIFSSLVNFILGLFFAIYMLAQKENLKRQGKKIFSAFLPIKFVNIISKICRRSIDSFGRFIVGQSTEAVILGTLCAIGMTVFGFPNVMIISVLLACASLIPIVGAFLGFTVGFLLICADSFEQAVWYLVFMLVLQQLEGNLIYPKVVGGSVGLPSLWVLFAITVGGNMFGIVGMFLAVPVFSVIYATLSEVVSYRNEKNTRDSQKTLEEEKEEKKENTPAEAADV